MGSYHTVCVCVCVFFIKKTYVNYLTAIGERARERKKLCEQRDGWDGKTVAHGWDGMQIKCHSSPTTAVKKFGASVGL